MTSTIELERAETVQADPRWKAVLQRNGEWDGAFVFAVTSTRIYCKPSCPSRRPRADRVRFYSSATDAAAAGFRACKRCHPDSVDSHNGRRVLAARVLALLDSNDQMTLAELSEATATSRSHLQRTFTEVIGVSPLEYATHLRTERMRAALSGNSSVSDAAFGAGFESLPSAYAAASNHLGMPPGRYRRGGAGVDVRYRITPCALGLAMVAMTVRGVCRIALGDDHDSLDRELRAEFPAATLVEADEEMSAAIDAVVAMASGHATSKDVPTDVQGTAFQQRVWRALSRIPHGRTVSYAELARSIDAPGAVRAVGSACGANPVALLVPCHRVVRSDGALGGYRWGLERKQTLLELESRIDQTGKSISR